MPERQEEYFRRLSNGELTDITVNKICNYLIGVEFQLEKIPPEILKPSGEAKITEYLTRLGLFIVRGNPSWEGLAVCFPGSAGDMAISNVGTVYLRMILYPILDLLQRIRIKENKESGFPCVYFIGERFSQVFLRKFSLLDQIVPHVIVISGDLYKSSISKQGSPQSKGDSHRESWVQMKLCNKLETREGLAIPSGSNPFVAGLVAREVPCSEGTDNPERLDILTYDKTDHSLVAFEIKGPEASRLESENLFLQGMEHRNWLEQNKMAVKLLFDNGPRGRRINTKKRVRLVLGLFSDQIPPLFNKLKEQACKEDKYLQVDFVNLKVVKNLDGKELVSLNRLEE
jgi:hypothetical protein